MKWLALLLLIPVACFAEELKPYDRLAKDNITVTAQAIKSGTKIDRNWQTSWGSFNRDTTQNKLVEVKLSLIANTGSLVKVEFFVVFRESGGSGERISPGSKVKGTPEGEWIFETTATRNEANYEAIKENYKSGEKITGWFVRVIKGDRVAGFAVSSSAYDKYAADPVYLSEIMENGK